MSALADSDRLHLPKGVRLKRCKVRDAWFLLAPERALALDPVGRHILEALDGARDLAGVIDHLAAQFDAPRDRIEGDVRTFLGQLAARRMVEKA